MKISQNTTNHIKSEESLLRRSYVEAATEARVQILNVLFSRGGLEFPLYELDPVEDPGHLTLNVGRLHGELCGRLEAGLGLSEDRGSEKTKPLERVRLATAGWWRVSPLLTSLTSSLLQELEPGIELPVLFS